MNGLLHPGSGRPRIRTIPTRQLPWVALLTLGVIAVIRGVALAGCGTYPFSCVASTPVPCQNATCVADPVVLYYMSCGSGNTIAKFDATITATWWTNCLGQGYTGGCNEYFSKCANYRAYTDAACTNTCTLTGTPVYCIASLGGPLCNP